MWKMGRSQSRIEDDAHLRGEGDFTLDRIPPDALHLAVVRSPAAAARLTELDTREARGMPGVVELLTGQMQTEDGLSPFQPRLRHPGPDGRDMLAPDVCPLSDGLLQYVGHPVAAVIAESPSEAQEAAEAVILSHEDRDPITDPIDAKSRDAPRVWPDMPDNICFRVEKGDRAAVDAALSEAAHVTRARLRISRVTAAALEPRAAIASYDPATGYRLDTGTQTPHRLAKDLAPVLSVDPGRIRVVSCDTGGSFGMKNTAYPEYALALWAARRTGRPVVWQASRTESFLSDAHARDQYADGAIALDKDHRILALDVAITAGIGACLGPATTHPPVANVAGLTGVYRTPAIHVSVEGVFTNCQHVAPYRGAGRPEATFIIERMLDLAALEVGLDRADLRRRNLIPPEAMPYRTPLGWIYDCGDFEAVLNRALEHAGWSSFDNRRSESKARGKLRGIGISNPIEIAGGPMKTPHKEYAALRIAAQGNGRIALGCCSSGQGHATVFRQILHDRLGIDPLAVEFITGDTGLVSEGTGTFGSRSLTAAGAALWQTMSDAIEILRPVAAEMLDCPPGELRFEDACYHAPAGTFVSFLEAAAKAGRSVEAEAFVSADGATFPNACHICEVEIDPETGQTSLESYVVVDDVGTVINPLLVEGQIVGGVAQGIGQALLETVAFEADSGQILSASFMDYAMPRAADIPQIEVLSHPVPTAMNPLGAKGAGEAGTVGGLAACFSAVCDALAEHGVSDLEMPATPGRIWQALQGAGK